MSRESYRSPFVNFVGRPRNPYDCWEEDGFWPDRVDAELDHLLVWVTEISLSYIHNGGLVAYLHFISGRTLPEIVRGFDVMNCSRSKQICAKALGEAASGVEHGEPFIVARGLKDEINGRFANQLIAAAEQCGVTSRPIGVPFGTDASAFGAEVPTVIFGPGSIAQAHTKDEWIAVGQLHQATEVLYQFCSTAM